MKLGVIGYGKRIRHVIGEIRRQYPDACVAGIVDPRPDAARSGADGRPVPQYSTTEELVRQARPDALLIGTRCSTHARYALEALPTGIPLYLEKPVATTEEDLLRLQQAAERYDTPVVVSFPLRLTSLVALVKEIADSGAIGTIEHVQAVNNVPYGSVYYQKWYRDESETGGLFLQKATHDFDYLTYVLGLQPEAVCAMTSKQVFKGDKPAGLRCADCDERHSCPENTYGTDREADSPFCAFAEDTGNEDSGSALIRFESGMHLSYSQNFFARRGAARRGARFLGYKGTVEFDFYTGEVQVHYHHRPRVDTYRLEDGGNHFGGDAALAANFIGVVEGRERSLSPLADGLLSAYMCLQAKRSADTGTFQSLRMPRTSTIRL